MHLLKSLGVTIVLALATLITYLILKVVLTVIPLEYVMFFIIFLFGWSEVNDSMKGGKR